MSDTPIAEQLAAALDMPWPLRRSWRIDGHLYEEPLERETMAKATQEDLDKLREAAVEKATQGDTAGANQILAIHDSVAEVTPAPEN